MDVDAAFARLGAESNLERFADLLGKHGFQYMPEDEKQSQDGILRFIAFILDKSRDLRSGLFDLREDVQEGINFISEVFLQTGPTWPCWESQSVHSLELGLRNVRDLFGSVGADMPSTKLLHMMGIGKQGTKEVRVPVLKSVNSNTIVVTENIASKALVPAQVVDPLVGARRSEPLREEHISIMCGLYIASGAPHEERYIFHKVMLVAAPAWEAHFLEHALKEYRSLSKVQRKSRKM